MKKIIRLNTSNKNKLAEYKEYLAPDFYDLIVTDKDQDEPDADPFTIIRYKASQLEDILVDDVSLDIIYEEGSDQIYSPGTNIRWELEQIRDSKYIGRRAIFSCMIAVRSKNKGKILVYMGKVQGIIVSPRGNGFGFSPNFQPDGLEITLAEQMVPEYNARFIALQKYLRGEHDMELEILEKWEGLFQQRN